MANKRGSADGKQQEQSRPDALNILVFSNDLDKVIAAFIIANGAAAMDMSVSMFFTFWGLNVLRKKASVRLSKPKGIVEKMFGWMMPKGASRLKLSKMNMGGIGTALLKRQMRKVNASDLPTLIDQARQQGVKLIACTMTMDVMGIRKEELLDGIGFGGVGTFIHYVDQSKATLFI